MKRFYTSLLFISLIYVSFSLHAQSTSDSTKTVSRSSFRGSVSFLSNAVYNGREDSTAVPYLSAEFGYYHKSGLYITASASYLARDHVFDLFSIDAGYNWEISDQFSASFSADKPFYNKSSTNIASAIKGSLDAGLIYDPGFITAETTFSGVFSQKTDMLFSLAISHQFSIETSDEDTYWLIEPGLETNLGTQNFLNGYKTKTGKRKLVTASNSIVSDGGKFQLLDYEFSLPISYNTKRWSITFSPVYAIPKNPITTTTTALITSASKTKSQVTTDTEQLKNVFYGQITFDFKFR